MYRVVVERPEMKGIVGDNLDQRAAWRSMLP